MHVKSEHIFVSLFKRVLMLCDDKQMARTWRRGDTANSSKSQHYSITAWTNCLSELLDRYACVRLVRLQGSSAGWTLNDARRGPTLRHRSAASSVPPSPPSGNCSVVADPSRPRLVMICSSREQNSGRATLFQPVANVVMGVGHSPPDISP